MNDGFFNYSTHVAQNWFERRAFVAHWWRRQADDHRWIPPYYDWIRRSLINLRDPHIQRMRPMFIHLEAIPRMRPANAATTFAHPSFASEQNVGGVLVLSDPRRDDGVGYLAMLDLINHEEPLERLLDAVMEKAVEADIQRLLGPVALTPRWQSGILLNAFDRSPPLGSPYNPPFVPELLETAMTPVRHSHLFHSMPTSSPVPQGPATLTPFDPQRLAADLLPLARACSDDEEFPAVDSIEMLSTLSSWGPFSINGWLALVDGQAVGFVLLQPDHATTMRRAQGGRMPWGALWLALRRKSVARRGRILLGGVEPEWQGRGIGHQLWQQANNYAVAAGWDALTVGPVEDGSRSAAFMSKMGAVPVQQYALYAVELGM